MEKHGYKWLRDETLNGIDCFVIKHSPVDKGNSEYVRQVVWIDKARYRMLKIDYYDQKDSLQKTLTFTDIGIYSDAKVTIAKLPWSTDHNEGWKFIKTNN